MRAAYAPKLRIMTKEIRELGTLLDRSACGRLTRCACGLEPLALTSRRHNRIGHCDITREVPVSGLMLDIKLIAETT